MVPPMEPMLMIMLTMWMMMQDHARQALRQYGGRRQMLGERDFRSSDYFRVGPWALRWSQGPTRQVQRCLGCLASTNYLCFAILLAFRSSDYSRFGPWVLRWSLGPARRVLRCLGCLASAISVHLTTRGLGPGPLGGPWAQHGKCNGV